MLAHHKLFQAVEASRPSRGARPVVAHVIEIVILNEVRGRVHRRILELELPQDQLEQIITVHRGVRDQDGGARKRGAPPGGR